MKNNTKKPLALRIIVLLIMIIGIVYSVWEAIINHDKGFAGFMPMIVMVPVAIYGIALVLLYEKKQKQK